MDGCKLRCIFAGRKIELVIGSDQGTRADGAKVSREGFVVEAVVGGVESANCEGGIEEAATIFSETWMGCSLSWFWEGRGRWRDEGLESGIRYRAAEVKL